MQHAGAIGAIIMNQRPMRWEGEILSFMGNGTDASEVDVIYSYFTI